MRTLFCDVDMVTGASIVHIILPLLPVSIASIYCFNSSLEWVISTSSSIDNKILVLSGHISNSSVFFCAISVLYLLWHNKKVIFCILVLLLDSTCSSNPLVLYNISNQYEYVSIICQLWGCFLLHSSFTPFSPCTQIV